MEFAAYDIALVPLIVSLVYLIGNMGVPRKWLPLFAIILGEISAFVYVAPGEPKEAVLAGLVMGLSAVGAWSGTKNMFQPEDKRKK